MKNNPDSIKKRNDDRKVEIIKLYKEGYSYREIARMLQLSHEWVRKLHMSTGIVDNA